MTDFDMSRMQQDAVNRVREMQRRAKKSVESAKEKSDKSDRQNGFIRKDSADNGNLQKNQTHQKNKGFDILRMFNFSRLEEDSDRSLILLILLLLAGDGCDEMLIFALIYLLI